MLTVNLQETKDWGKNFWDQGNASIFVSFVQFKDKKENDDDAGDVDDDNDDGPSDTWVSL